MDFFLDFIFRLGSFSVLAQTLLHFTENKNYDKYIRILCNIMVLSLVVVPVMEIFRGDTATQMNQLITLYEQQLLDIEEKSVEEQVQNPVQNLMKHELEQEIKYKLNNPKLQEEGYQVTRVTVQGMHGDGTWEEKDFCIQVEVSGKEDLSKIKIERKSDEIRERETYEEERIKNLCAEVLETNTTYLEVNISE